MRIPPRSEDSIGGEAAEPSTTVHESTHGPMEENAEQSQDPAVVFDGIELLDDPRAGYPHGPLQVLRKANVVAKAKKVEDVPNTYTLDVDNPEVDPNGTIAIRVTFHVKSAKPLVRELQLDESLVNVFTGSFRETR